MESKWRFNIPEQGWAYTDIRLLSRWIVDPPGDYWFAQVAPGDETWQVIRRLIIGGIQIRQIVGSAGYDEVLAFGEADS